MEWLPRPFETQNVGDSNITYEKELVTQTIQTMECLTETFGHVMKEYFPHSIIMWHAVI